MAQPQEVTEVKGPNGYLAVKPTPETAARIAQRVSDLGIVNAIPAEKLHVTLYYAPDGLPDDIHGSIDDQRIHLAFANGEPHTLGEGEYAAVVLPLDAPTLHERHDQIKRITGVDHSYPDYLPHLSLKYGPEPEDVEKLQADVTLAKMVIDLTGEYCEDLNG